jgi:hypothetical protein
VRFCIFIASFEALSSPRAGDDRRDLVRHCNATNTTRHGLGSINGVGLKLCLVLSCCFGLCGSMIRAKTVGVSG